MEQLSSGREAMRPQMFAQMFGSDKEEYVRLTQIVGFFTDDPFVFKLVLLILLLDSSKNQKICNLQNFYITLMIKRICKTLQLDTNDEDTVNLVRQDIIKCYSGFVRSVSDMVRIKKKYISIRPSTALAPPPPFAKNKN